MRVSETPPVLFSVAKWMQRKGIRGGHRLEQTCANAGMLDVIVRYPIDAKRRISIPIGYRSFDGQRVRDYERENVALIRSQMKRLPGPITVIDCGADIGVMSCKLVVGDDRVNRVIAFEPNAKAFPYLQTNLSALGVESQALNKAVSNFVGRGELRRPAHDPDSEYAAFLERSDDGSIDVTTIDALQISLEGGLVVKIDVEGAELSVINGAWNTLSAAPGLVLVMEAHREQVRRTGIDTSDIVRRLRDLGPIEVVVAEEPDLEIDWSRPFFDQAKQHLYYNLCVTKLR